jgi:hypothetical protein
MSFLLHPGTVLMSRVSLWATSGWYDPSSLEQLGSSGMSRGRMSVDLDAGTKRETIVSALVGLITASQGDRLLIADGTRVERS